MGSPVHLTHSIDSNCCTITDDFTFHNPLYFFNIYLIFCQNKLSGLCFLSSPSLSKQSQTLCHKHTIMIRHCFVQCPVNVSSLPAYHGDFHSLDTSRPAIHPDLGNEVNFCLETREFVCCRPDPVPPEHADSPAAEYGH